MSRHLDVAARKGGAGAVTLSGSFIWPDMADQMNVDEMAVVFIRRKKNAFGDAASNWFSLDQANAPLTLRQLDLIEHGGVSDATDMFVEKVTTSPLALPFLVPDPISSDPGDRKASEVPPESASSKSTNRPLDAALEAGAQANYAEQMNHPSREEIDAKLEAIEARMDARAAETAGKIDSLIVKMDERDKLYHTQFVAIGEQLRDLRGLKSTVITSTIATGGVVVGLVYAALALAGASFDSGRETAQLTAAAEKSSAAAQQAANAANQAAGMARLIVDPKTVPKADQPAKSQKNGPDAE